MELILERIQKEEKITIGRLSILKGVDDASLAGEIKDFLCDTLEPRWVPTTEGKRLFRKKTAITPGRYPVVITYSEKHQKWLPLLLWVRKFKDVRILVGKTVDDIDSGFIVGLYKGGGRIVDSPNMVYELKRLIVDAKNKNEGVFITVK